MAALLEIQVRTADDARAAEAGGADRVHVVGDPGQGGYSPEPETVAAICQATTIHVRPMLRLREGFSTDGGEMTRLRGLSVAYRDAGADGMVLGFLNGYEEIDVGTCQALTGDRDWHLTFHRAVDAAMDTDAAWASLRGLDLLDSVLTAGSPRGMDAGIDALVDRCRRDPEIARLVLAGGGMTAEHVPWLVRAGVRQFHLGSKVRADGTLTGPVQEDLVAAWRDLIDDEVRHLRSR